MEYCPQVISSAVFKKVRSPGYLINPHQSRCKEQSSILMDFRQKPIFHKLKSSGWDYIKWYADSTKLVPGCTNPLILAAQQCPNMDVIKLKVAVLLMIPLIDFSNKTFDFLSLHSMIETVEQNRDGFLKEVFHEYRSFSNFDIYDSKTTSFSVKLGCYENDGMFMLINASSGLSSDLS
ncbi:unnamed protein product [Schistosoma haematobium]|nr:unnamed protein product [Schistosoma haematobium]